jgi:hypothetical protein
MYKKLTGSMMMLIMLLLTAGCEYDPNAESLTITEPDERDLVGVYEIDKIRLPAELADLKLDTRLELKANGTFTARNIPPSPLGELLPTVKFPSTLTSSSGIWSKRKCGYLDPGHHTIWGIYLADKHYTIANANGPRTEWLSVRCTGQSPPYGILFQLGDPDYGYAIHLKCVNAKANPHELEPNSTLKNKKLLLEENTGFRQ